MSKSDANRFAEEKQEAVVALLNQPFILRNTDTELFLTIRDNFQALRDWFFEQTGWSLILTRQFARLEKMPEVWQPWMAVDGFRDGRDYAYFTYGLWFLEGLGDGQQFLLSEMVEAIREHLVTEGIAVDFTWYANRLSMARALKKLRDLDVLQAVEGDELDWVRAAMDSDGRDDVLYQSSALARYLLQRLPEDLEFADDHRGPSGADASDMSASRAENATRSGAKTRTGETTRASDAATVSDAAASGPAADSAAHRRHSVMRRLLQEPVVYDWQWTDDERRYVQTQRASLIDRIADMTGLLGRRLREGLIFTWPELGARMDLFPTQGVQSDIVILIATAIRAKLLGDENKYDKDENGSILLTRSELEALVLELRDQYGERWSKEYRELSTHGLAENLVRHLEEWNLGAPSESGGLKVYPGLMRWSGEYEVDGGEEA